MTTIHGIPAENLSLHAQGNLSDDFDQARFECLACLVRVEVHDSCDQTD